MDKKDEQGGANATADDFARMSAGLEKITEALKTGDAVKLREAAVEAVGEEPQLDEKDKEINSLKERLKGQAIASAMAKLTEDLADGAGPTVLRLIDRGALTFNEDFSEVSGLKEAIKAIVKEFPGFAKVKESAEDVAAREAAEAAATANAPAADGDRQTEAKTPQQIAADVVAAEKVKVQAAVDSANAAVTAAAVVAPATTAPATPAAAAPTPLGQDVKLRESAPADVFEVTPAVTRKLRLLEKRMLVGNTKAMKQHRDLRTQYGI